MSAAPETMRAVRLVGAVQGSLSAGFTEDDVKQALKVETVPVPKPRNGQVLVKVFRAAINPADLSMLKGSYGKASAADEDTVKPAVSTRTEGGDSDDDDDDKDEDTVASAGVKSLVTGSEGCGLVVASGGGILAWRLLGKRVAFSQSRDGAWTEYAVVQATRCIDMGPESAVSWDACSSCFVNPMTVISFVEIAKSGGHQYILHSAAASALGKMLIKHAKRNGINVLCVVRRPEQAEACRLAGADPDLIFNSSDSDFHDRLLMKCEQLNVRLGFDAVSGDMVGTMLHAMAPGATLRVYGGLSEQPPQHISTKDLIFRKKTLSGYWLTEYVKSKSLLGLLQWTWTVAAHINDDFALEVADVIPLERIHDALVSYTKNMSKGKVLLDCSGNAQ